MSKRIFVAGASGVIGRRLIPQLLAAGHQVTGMTRSAHAASEIERQGATAFVVDVFDRARLIEAVGMARPEVVIHQLTDLALLARDPRNAAAAITRNALIRKEGTRNLVAAALAVGTRRMIAQSIAWAYAPGTLPHDEDDPLDRDAPAPRATTIEGVIALEDAVLRTPGVDGTILRYGQLYGPGTATMHPAGASPVHVDAAAHAALLALERDATGIFNIAEPNDTVATTRAKARLGWDPGFRMPHRPG